MMARHVREQPALRGEMRRAESMARHTSWRVGGPADRFFVPADVEDLAAFLGTLAPDEPLLWLGLGSNLLVRDGGFRGTVVCTRRLGERLELVDPHHVRAGAGVANAKLARFAARYGLTGAEFLAGIPGTVGGALAMNAGAWGGETWRIVSAVEVIDRHGRVHRRTPEEFRTGYRTVEGRAGEWFVAAEFGLESSDAQSGRARIRELLNARATSQPVNQPSAGSVFRNPPGDHAARLIETAGLKGLRVGGARVSERHANFIVNEGQATAADIEALIATVRERVAEMHGVGLELEVRIVGEALS